MVSEDDPVATLPLLGELTYREAHAFEHGLYSGLVEGAARTEYSTGRERHYWRMGYLPTMLTRYTTIALAGIGFTNL